MLYDLLQNYLYTLKDIQDMGMEKTPYALEEQRNKLHHQIIEELPLEKNNFSTVYLLSKRIFENLDIINGLYSNCSEWKLQTVRDISMMAKDLYRYLTSSECLMYLEGKIDFPVHIKNLNMRNQPERKQQ